MGSKIESKNGENGEVTSGKGKVEMENNEQKTGNKSLRKRMRSILTSPVHLFRRIVLRKRSKNRRSEKEKKVENPLALEAIEVAKERNLPCYLLFVGLQGSGKSTTISKLFNGKRPSPNDHVHTTPSIVVHSNASVGDFIGLKVVDTPGLCGSDEQDAEIVKSLSSFLKRDLPCRIPTVTFIVARLDDDDDDVNRQETDQPGRFARMLKSLHQIEKLITDQRYSNIVLLLTHSQKAKDVSSSIFKYQQEFASLLPVTSPVHVLAIDNIRYGEKLQNYHDIIFTGLREFAGKRGDHSLNALVDWFTGKAKRFSISFQQENFPVQSLLSKESFEIMASDLLFQPYFVVHHHKRRKSQRKSKSEQQQQLLTCIPPGSQITLADKSLINIEKCVVGDKLLSMGNKTVVVTGISKASSGMSFGTIYCAAMDNKNEKMADEKFIYMHTTENGFELVSASKANVPETTSENFYFLELDCPNGTFIMNSFPCFACFNE